VGEGHTYDLNLTGPNRIDPQGHRKGNWRRSEPLGLRKRGVNLHSGCASRAIAAGSSWPRRLREELVSLQLLMRPILTEAGSRSRASGRRCRAMSDILVNNAVFHSKAVDLFSVLDCETWRKGWELKVLGLYRYVRLYYTKMKPGPAVVILKQYRQCRRAVWTRIILPHIGHMPVSWPYPSFGGQVWMTISAVVGINPGPSTPTHLQIC